MINIQVSMQSDLTIYEQIEYQIKDLILDETLKPNELMPSIRQLSQFLRVGVITVKRAYDELVTDSFLYSMVGKGFYVSPMNLDQIRKTYILQLKKELLNQKELIKKTKLTKKEVFELIEAVMEA